MPKELEKYPKKFDEIIGCDMGLQYYNYKGTNSIVPLVVARSNYEVTLADVGMNGRILDGSVLKRSKLGQMLEEDSLNLPAPEPLPGRSVPIHYVFIGDDAFALKPNLMKPFPRKNLDLFTRICNCGFSRARRISQNVFGIVTNRLRVHRSPISLHPKNFRQLTVEVLTLHNWLQNGQSKTVYMPPGFCDTYGPTTQSFIPGSRRKENNHNCLNQLQPLQHGSNPSVAAKKIREECREYFSLGGAVNWQWEYCLNQN